MPHRRGLAFLLIASFLAISLPLSAQGQTAPPAESEASAANLARSAKATASESQDDLTPEKAIDGNRDTRWSGIPGHNSGVWFQLDWDQPVTLGEVIIRQFDRFVMELDVQVWDAARNDWRTAEHFGKPGTRLPGVVLCRFAPLQTARLRIGNITNGPSFTEVEAYAEHLPRGLAIRAAGDCDGHFLGVVTDPEGLFAVGDAQVELSGTSAAGPWQVDARSDAAGMFTAAMPLGLIGEVQVRVTSENRTATAKFPATDLQYGLTPRGTHPAPAELPGPWKFAVDPPEGFWQPEFDDAPWQPIQVPAHWEMQGFRARTGVGGYRTRFAAPDPKDARVKLLFDGVYSGAEVWVNGKLVAHHEGGATPFECDVTEVIQPGDNLLALRVTEHTLTSDRLDQMSSYADFPLAGIMRPVRLIRLPARHVGALALQTKFDERYQDSAIEGRIAVLNESAQPLAQATLLLKLLDPAGQEVGLSQASWPVEAPAWQRADVSISLPVTRPQTWDAEHPRLYTLEIALMQDGRPLHQVTQRFGFRQTDIRGPALLINGTPVKFRGTCHHDTHPLLGRAVTPEVERTDVRLMKEANLNAVRTSHYPPLPELLDIADELGLYVEDEAPFCWVGVADDLRNAPHIIQLTAELIARDRNHPSVFMWSLCNESGFGASFERSHAWVRAADPSRPTGAATSAWLEIATLHNPIASQRIDENEKLEQPLLFDESFAPYQGIFNDVGELWLDPGIRDYYVAPLAPIYNRLMKSRATQGSFIWCWADDVFCVPGRGLEIGRGRTAVQFLNESYAMPGRGQVGDAPWGVVDGWRRPKPEFWHVKKLHSPVRVKETPLTPASSGGELHVPVENQYAFTNLSELEMKWELAGASGTGKADVAPRSAGELVIRPPQPAKPGDVLKLSFTDAEGRLVDTFAVPIERIAETTLPGHSPKAEPLVMVEESTLSGRAVRIIGSEFELAFDRHSGALRRCVAFGEPLLLDFPAIHILASGERPSPLPDPIGFECQSVEARPDGDNVRVKLAGKYRDLEGSYDFVITPAGEIDGRYAFSYSGPDLVAREIGWTLQLPRACDSLAWERQGEWGVYPDDHIGRAHGEARAFFDHPAKVPPEWPWARDNTPLGSNDFRSTKRNIRWAALVLPQGPAVLVLSDGRQHSRASLASDRVHWQISDWYGGTHVGWWEWELNYGKGKEVKKGAKLESKLQLQLINR